MWRAVLAFAAAGDGLSAGERRLLKGCLAELSFSGKQMDIFRADLKRRRDVSGLYEDIANPVHRQKFCALIRALVWCGGDLDRQEEIILGRIPCLGGGEGAEMLYRSRQSRPDISFCHEYERVGMAGSQADRPGVEIRV